MLLATKELRQTLRNEGAVLWTSFLRAMKQLLPKPAPIAVAVSGGSDSLALLYLAWAFQQRSQQPLYALTVDHGLRPESAEEARQVSSWCAALNLPHVTLRWDPSDTYRRLQERAREARYELLEAWAWRHQVPYVLLGHTWEDQAETFMMRQKRPQGPLGLAGMSAVRPSRFVTYLRPLLQRHRTELQTLLSDLQQPWITDPSNTNLSFERIQVRQAHPSVDQDDWRLAVRIRQQEETQVNAAVMRVLQEIR